MALQDEKLRSDKKSDNTMIAKTRFEVFYGQISDAYQTLGMAVLSNHKENSKSESSSNTLALANGEADSASNSSQNKIFEEEGLWARALCFHEKDGPKIAVAPIDVGRIVHEQLLVPSESVVFTSATLANDKGDQGPMGIEWATGHLYLDSSKRFKSGLYLPPVFDYRAKTRVYFCDDMKDIYHENFVTETLKEIIPLIKNIQGGSLLLFSSKKRFEQAREILLQKLEGEIPLFIQGMGQSVVEDFKNSGKGVLLGMEMFGEGIDIPGKALQFLFIDKIPDLRQDLVIQKRRDFFEKKFGHEFTDYFLAHRTRSLHQKLGRLLRTNQDVGTAIVVDSRIK